MGIDSKHIVVTGAAAGIGRATALAALQQGARVTSLDVVDPEIESITHLHCDVSRIGDWEMVASKVSKPDHVFLNAGTMSAPYDAAEEQHRFMNVEFDAYQKIVGVNIDGVVLGLKTLLPVMTANSSIVVTASLAGVYGYAHDPLYAMTKHAVVGLTKSLAPDVAGRGIRINAVCPNRVDTQLLPRQMRNRDFLRPDSVAGEVLRLFEVAHTGGIWGKMYDDQPAYLIGLESGRSPVRVIRSALGRLVHWRMGARSVNDD